MCNKIRMILKPTVLSVLAVICHTGAVSQSKNSITAFDQETLRAYTQNEYVDLRRGIPWEPVEFQPLSGAYFLEISGEMDLKTYKNAITGVTLIPRRGQSGYTSAKFKGTKYERVSEFDLWKPLPNSTQVIRCVDEKGGFVEGGFWALHGNIHNTETETWYSGAKLSFPSDRYTSVELRNLNLVRDTVMLQPSLGEVSVKYKRTPVRDGNTMQIIWEPQLYIRILTENLEYYGNCRFSEDLDDWDAVRSGYSIQDRASRSLFGDNAGFGLTVGSGMPDKYVFMFLFQGLQPYANVWEVGKGWLNSLELVEKLFRVDEDAIQETLDGGGAEGN